MVEREQGLRTPMVLRKSFIKQLIVFLVPGLKKHEIIFILKSYLIHTLKIFFYLFTQIY